MLFDHNAPVSVRDHAEPSRATPRVIFILSGGAPMQQLFCVDCQPVATHTK